MPLVGDGEYSGSGVVYPEALIYQNLFEAATFSALYVVANTLAFGTASTVTVRKNGANSSLAVSVPGGSFGAFADNIDSSAGGNGDGFNYAFACGGAASNGQATLVSCVMTSTHSASWMNGEIPGAIFAHSLAFNTGLVYGLVGGAGDWATTESVAQYIFRFPVHTFGMYVYVTNNSINGSTSFKMRKNGAFGNQAVSVGASGTGAFTDAVDTDDFASGDISTYGYTPSGSSGTMDTTSCVVTCYSTDRVSCFAGINGWTEGSTFASTNNFTISGDGAAATSAFNAGQVLIRQVPAKMLDMAINVTLSTGGLMVTVNSQINGVNGALAVSASANGYFEDLVDSDAVVPTQLYGLAVTPSPLFENFTFYISPTVMAQFSPPFSVAEGSPKF